VPARDLPIVVVPGGLLLRNPGSRELLDAAGQRPRPGHDPYPTVLPAGQRLGLRASRAWLCDLSHRRGSDKPA